MRVIVALVTAVAVTGCSLVLVDGPSPNVPRNVYPSCDDSNTFPVIDAVIAGVYTLAAIGAATRDDADTSDRDGTVIGAALGAALFGVSSWVGFGRTGACRARRQELMQQGMPGYYPPPPPGYYPPPPQQGYPQQPQGYPQQQGYPQPQQGYPPPQQGYPQAPASEGQACHPQLGCQAGLTCASGLCVQLPPGGTAP